MRIVLDTNILLTSFSDRSATHWIVDALKNKRFELAYTTQILAEYEEKFSEHWNAFMAETVITTILELPNTIPTTVYYSLNLLTNDPDDNKFADCAFASNATFLVSNDNDFTVLKSIDFPVIRVVTLQEFEQILFEKNSSDQ
ncbi:MAG: putative toxin-antitoxin system toxin component, PIN family [Chitinophagaceae bacterium]|nr:MAG: putative toxin-antitoxin system toxin component, PIN family [Chitinophagaceae bacterium]